MLRNSRPLSTPAVSAAPLVPCRAPAIVVMTDKEARTMKANTRLMSGFSHRRRVNSEAGLAPMRRNRWRFETGGDAAVVVAYRLYCVERWVTTNTVNEDD